MFPLCSHMDMTRDSIADTILNAPAWARLGLTMPDERLRERAADTLAATILERVFGQQTTPDPNQLTLPL